MSCKARHVPSLPFALPVGTNCTISVSFAPTAQGASSGTLHLTTDASPAADDVTLSGNGTKPPDVASGGCTIATASAGLDPTLWLLALLAVAVLIARRRRRHAGAAARGRRQRPRDSTFEKRAEQERVAIKLRARPWLFALLLVAAGTAHAQADYSLYGVLDLSYGRFEPSGFVHEDRFNSNSLSASFVGVNVTEVRPRRRLDARDHPGDVHSLPGSDLRPQRQ